MDLKKAVKRAIGFDPLNDCKIIYKAFKGSNENGVMDILTRRGIDQRLMIREHYEKLYGTPLLEEIKGELMDERAIFLKALLMNNNERDVYYLHIALEQIKTDTICLNDILGTRTNSEIKNLKTAYYKAFSRDILTDVKGCTFGFYQNALEELLKGNRKEYIPVNEVDDDEEEGEGEDTELAHDLYESIDGTLEEFTDLHIKILCTESFEMLKEVDLAISDLFVSRLSHHIKQNFKGILKNLFLVICEYSLAPYQFYTYRILTAIHKNDVRDIGRLLIDRREIDLVSVVDFIEELKLQKFSDVINSVFPDLDASLKKAFFNLVGC